MDLKAGDTVPETYKQWFREDIRHVEKWRKEAKLDYEFRDSHQWSEEEEKILEDRRQPPTVFNLILPIVDAVCGQEISNRQEARAYPREQGDVKASEIISEAMRWFRDRADADDNDSEAFRDTVTSGMGWTETRLDYEENPDGDLRDDRLDPFEMAWDYNSKKRNLKDSTRFWHIRKVPVEEARALVEGNWEDEELDAAWAVDGIWDSDNPHVSEKVRDRTKRNVDGTISLTEVILVHCQWQERETYWRVPTPPAPETPQMPLDVGQMSGMQGPQMPQDGGMQPPMAQGQDQMQGAPMPPQAPPQPEYKELSEAEFKQFQKFAETNIQAQFALAGAIRAKRKVWYRAYLGKQVLKVSPTACPDHSNFKCITGKRDQTRRQWYGLVRVMRDPNSWTNKFFSQMLHLINSSAKGGIMAERGTAFDNDAEAEESWARQDRITWMKPGGLNTANPKWAAKPQMVFPQGLQFLMEYAADSVRRTGGVSLELLGQKEAGQAGVLEYQRRQAGLTILAPIFDNLKSYRRDQAELILYYIQHDLSDGRLIRVIGQEGAEYVPLVNQATLEYDIIIDDSPQSPNQKEMAWQIITQILPIIKDMLSPETMLMFLESSPLPSAILDKMKAKVQSQAQTPAGQVQQAMPMLQAKEAQAKIADTEAAAELKRAQAVAALKDAPNPQAEYELKQLETTGHIQVKQFEAQAAAQVAQQKAQGDIAVAQAKASADMQMQQQKHRGDMQMAAQKHAVDMQTAQQDAVLKERMAAQDASLKERVAGSQMALAERTTDAKIKVADKQASAAAKRQTAKPKLTK